MTLVKKIDMDCLSDFNKDNSFLSIVERNKPSKADHFFELLLKDHLNINETVYKKSIFNDIQNILSEQISNKIVDNNFYISWIKDMANICTLFCNNLEKNSLSYSLETSRSCKRFHIDNVPFRLLVTYYGKGTEWFPSHACDYSAYYKGEDNNKIIKKKSEQKFLNTWDIAIFKGQKFVGGENGILHRTPDDALNNKSLLMRLDDPSYLN